MPKLQLQNFNTFARLIISQNFGMFTYILGINLFKNDYFQTEITFCL